MIQPTRLFDWIYKDELAKVNSIYTPGPWLVERYGPNAYKVDGSEPICTLNVMTFQSEGNANLISAAPELYAALRVAVQFFDMNGGDESYSWLPELKAALAKAEGKV